MKTYKHILIEEVQHIRAVNPFHMYTGNLNPEWKEFNEANPPIVWYGPAFDGTKTDEEIEKFLEYSSFGNTWVECSERFAKNVLSQVRQAAQPKEVEQVKLSDKIGHINCDPEALKDPEFVKAINQMAELAYNKVKEVEQVNEEHHIPHMEKLVNQPVQQEEPEQFYCRNISGGTQPKCDSQCHTCKKAVQYRQNETQLLLASKFIKDIHPSTPIVSEGEQSLAKAEAIKLRNRMYNCPYVQDSEAKRCALVAVDVILTDCVHAIGITTPFYRFYEQVKIELQKL